MVTVRSIAGVAGLLAFGFLIAGFVKLVRR